MLKKIYIYEYCIFPIKCTYFLYILCTMRKITNISHVVKSISTLDFEENYFDTSDQNFLTRGHLKKRWSIHSILKWQTWQFKWLLTHLDVISLVWFTACGWCHFLSLISWYLLIAENTPLEVSFTYVAGEANCCCEHTGDLWFSVCAIKQTNKCFIN